MSVDYRNEITVLAKSGVGAGIYTSPTLSWENSALDTLVHSPGSTILSMACDYINGLIFYFINPNTPTNPDGHTSPQLRVVGYDGSGDSLVTTEPPVADENVPPYQGGDPPNPLTYQVGIVQGALWFDPSSGRIYWLRSYTHNVGTPPAAPTSLRSVTQLRSILPGGTKQTDSQLELTDSPTVHFQHFNPHFRPDLGLVVSGLLRGSERHLVTYDVSAPFGAATKNTILSSSGSPGRAFVSPQISYKDSRIYFNSFPVGQTPPEDFATYNSVAQDGSDEQEVFSFTHPTNDFGWVSDTTHRFRLGCGLELTGSDYGGVG